MENIGVLLLIIKGLNLIKIKIETIKNHQQLNIYIAL
jgi:hypothetical protein